MTRLGRIKSAHVILRFALIALASAAAGFSVAQDTPDVRLANQMFDWLDAREDAATFEWSVDVVNETDRAYRVRVILELLDDDDRVVNRDERGVAADTVTITVEANSQESVQASGQLPYDLAAEVVSLRHRRELVDSIQP